MERVKKFLNRMKQKKGITGADIVAAISVITLTVGIVTAIYVNTVNKSKDNLRYANAVRIATNIIESIQKKPFEYLTAICPTNDPYEIVGDGNVKVFDTKILNGFRVKIYAKKATAVNYDVARDVTINVTYKSSNSYKTITLRMLKEKELMDMTNPPDFSLIPNYAPQSESTTKVYYYPIAITTEGTDLNYKITSKEDINWYDYEEGKYALVYETTSGVENVGKTGKLSDISSNVYVWIPRFVSKEGTGIGAVQFLYGASDYKITFNQYGDLYAYGLSYTGATEGGESLPVEYNAEYSYHSFASGDGLGGVWYKLAGNYTDDDVVKKAAKELQGKILPYGNRLIELENNMEESVTDEILLSNNHLYAYYNSTNYKVGDATWSNEIGNYANINIIGNAIVQSDGGININRKSNETYATIDISEKSESDLTIYLVAKAVEKNDDNARFLEIPKASTSGNTPTVHVANSNTVGYGVFLNDQISSASAFEYNVIVVRLEKNENNSGGVMSTFVNNQKEIDLNYNGRGNIISLAQCAYNNKGYGNNDYKMLAIYDIAQSDEEILSNVNILKTQYNMFFSKLNELISSNIQFGNVRLAFDNNKTTTNPNDAITFYADQRDSYIGCTYLENINPYKYDIAVMGYGIAKDYSVILQGQNSDDTWENIGGEHILTTSGNGNANYGETIEYSFDVSTDKEYKGLRIINNYSNSGNGEAFWHAYSHYAMRIVEAKFYYNE